MSDLTFGQWLKHERETLGFTQAELARKLACATITLRKIEADERRPAREIVNHLADIFELKLAQRAAFFKFARNGTFPTFFSVEPNARQFRARGLDLPLATSPFFGRDTELETICDLLQNKNVRALTLTGTGGIGKTRLALEAGDALRDKFHDGIFFIDLAPLTNPALVPSAIVHALKLDARASNPLAVIQTYLRGKQLLLLLDNFEQILSAAPIVQALAGASRRVKILITSRQPLHLAREHIFQVPPLDAPDPKRLPPLETFSNSPAASLFMSHARAARADFVLTQDNARFIARICTQLDGIPLALELAAARVRYFPIQEIASRLEQRFRLLRADSEDFPPRHQTLTATIDWSYDLLSPPERALFARLSVFNGSCTARAAEQVCADELLAERDVLHLLTQLVDKSLLQVNLENNTARFRPLETIREYARDKLIQTSDETKTRNRHFHYFLRLAETMEPKLQRAEQIEGLAELEQAHDNFRAALDWSTGGGNFVEGLRLTNALARFWYLRGYWSEGRERLAELVARLEPASHALLRARALNAAATLARPQDDEAAAQMLYNDSLALCNELGDAGLYEKGYALRGLGGIANARGDYARANTLFAESAQIFSILGERWQLAYSTFGLAIEAYNLGNHAAAQMHIQECLTIFREYGDRWGIAVALDFLGEVARTEGDDAKAQAYYQEILSLRRALNDKQGIAVSLHALGHVALHRGAWADAQQCFGESMEHYRELGSPFGIANCLAGFGGVAAGRGELKRAARLFGAADALLKSQTNVLDPVDQRELERNRALARAQLDADEFATAWREGRALNKEKAIAFALE